MNFKMENVRDGLEEFFDSLKSNVKLLDILKGALQDGAFLQTVTVCVCVCSCCGQS